MAIPTIIQPTTMSVKNNMSMSDLVEHRPVLEALAITKGNLRMPSIIEWLAPTVFIPDGYPIYRVLNTMLGRRGDDIKRAVGGYFNRIQLDPETFRKVRLVSKGLEHAMDEEKYNKLPDDQKPIWDRRRTDTLTNVFAMSRAIETWENLLEGVSGNTITLPLDQEVSDTEDPLIDLIKACFVAYRELSKGALPNKIVLGWEAWCKWQSSTWWKTTQKCYYKEGKGAALTPQDITRVLGHPIQFLIEEATVDESQPNCKPICTDFLKGDSLLFWDGAGSTDGYGGYARTVTTREDDQVGIGRMEQYKDPSCDADVLRIRDCVGLEITGCAKRMVCPMDPAPGFNAKIQELIANNFPELSGPEAELAQARKEVGVLKAKLQDANAEIHKDVDANAEASALKLALKANENKIADLKNKVSEKTAAEDALKAQVAQGEAAIKALEKAEAEGQKKAKEIAALKKKLKDAEGQQ